MEMKLLSIALRLRALIELIKNDTLLRKDLKAQNANICDAIIEGVLQH